MLGCEQDMLYIIWRDEVLQTMGRILQNKAQRIFPEISSDTS